jgi:hypothetical protein
MHKIAQNTLHAKRNYLNQQSWAFLDQPIRNSFLLGLTISGMCKEIYKRMKQPTAQLKVEFFFSIYSLKKRIIDIF